MLTGAALWQTAALARLMPIGIPTNATVIAREMRLPQPDAAYAESVVTLLINDPALGVFQVETPHPPATQADLWPGGSVAVAVVPGSPPVIAYVPTLLQAKRRATLIALAVTLALAAVSGILSRWTLRR